MNYLWTDETEQFRHKTLEKDISTDVCIIGGGIAGIMCAAKLTELGIDNVVLEGSHALIKGSRGKYSIHLGSGVIHRQGGHQIQVLPVHSQSRGKLFLPFLDEDPKTAEIMSKIVLFAGDTKIKDPYILDQLQE